MADLAEEDDMNAEWPARKGRRADEGLATGDVRYVEVGGGPQFLHLINAYLAMPMRLLILWWRA